MDPKKIIKVYGVPVSIGGETPTREQLLNHKAKEAGPELLAMLKRVTVYIEAAGLIPPCVREANKLMNSITGDA